jgi:aldose 1-epimerase
MKHLNLTLLGLCALPVIACSPRTETADAIYNLKNEAGMEVTVTSFGGRITSILVPDRDGVKRDVVLGFDKVEDYYPENHQTDFGASIGRYANRIAGAKFSLDGTEYSLSANDHGNCLHGGATGWQYQPYTVVEADASHIRLRMDSPDGDNGFPGAVTAYVTYTLTADNRIDIAYSATTTAPTVINMTNHSYFNLSGDPSRSIVEDQLYINASEYTPIDKLSIPYGENIPVEGTPMDFRTMHRIGDRIGETGYEQIVNGSGYDHNWVLDTAGDDSKVAATVYCEQTGIALDVYTDEPGVQVYTGNFLDGSITGKAGKVYGRRSGICLETQHYPDSPNRPEWPSVVLRPGETYTSHCVYAFYIK